MTSMDDYKPELTATQNLMLCAGLSQKTVLLCSQEFADNNLNNYISSGLQFQVCDISILLDKMYSLENKDGYMTGIYLSASVTGFPV